MSLPKLTGYVCWLIPEESGSVIFRDLIKNLSQKYAAPVFSPHITLCHVSVEDAETGTSLSRFCKSVSPFQITFQNVQCRNHPYQKIVLPIQVPAGLQKVYEACKEWIPEKEIKSADPHLSLLYSSLPCSKLKEDMIQVKAKLPLEVTIQKAVLVRVSGGPDQWEIIESCALEIQA